MPSHAGARPLKAWRYVGVYGPELMLCAGAVRIGRASQSFWAVLDRATGQLHERTTLGAGRAVALEPGRLRVLDRDVQIDLELHERAGIEVVHPAGASYAWTRKQAVRARGVVAIAGEPRPLEAGALIDDTRAYYERHTAWRWSAGVGETSDGRELAWNLVDGVNDSPTGSERTIWVDGIPREPGPAQFTPDLAAITFEPGGELRFSAEATREANENLLLIRSRYRQPFGSFTGTLGPGLQLASGFGVVEDHDVHW
jgi:Domain of unknown function (DUF2804), C-terminal